MKPHLFTGLSTNKRYLVVALASVLPCQAVMINLIR